MTLFNRHLPREISDELAWFKSSYSSNEGGNCVEVATTPSTVHIRDSKIPTGNVLTVSPSTWSVFLERVTG
ncbi:DUF397 domain-containing protein [Streptomyces sp. CA-210063]|uniref:DUF397 domain-containing protein n=1 Tax=Streptomyces sp. CA-210063 TaxID=2801029 RepID=UPI00214C1A0A|nr:DUF397 domain-containing protein [Streptomyces sp. CA-210063]UUU30680.1 DUF397 domain-containing protein [Streptomyces sp. CA-210063]